MVTIIKIDRVNGVDWVHEFNKAFQEDYVINIMECVLIKDSECGNYEYLYVFLDEIELNGFIRLLNEFNVTIYSAVDFTDSLINIINNNNSEQFESEFEGMMFSYKIIRDFTLQEITKDMVLDKINTLGVDSLTYIDQKILEA